MGAGSKGSASFAVEAVTNAAGGMSINNVAAPTVALFLGMAGVGTQINEIPMPDAGRFIGISWRQTALITAGFMTFRPAVNGVAVGAVVQVVAASGLQGFIAADEFGATLPANFVAGNSVGIEFAADAAYLPAGTTDVQAFLWVALNRGKMPGGQ